MQLFQNRPFDFLVKPISQNRLRMLMDEYFRIFPQEERYSFDNTDYELLFLTLCGAKLVLSLLTESYYRRREKERISHQMELFVDNYASVVFHHITLICPSYIERAFHIERLFLLYSIIF